MPHGQAAARDTQEPRVPLPAAPTDPNTPRVPLPTTPTIADVARLAKVSRTTASDALRGHGRVSEATREAVTAAARELGYAPNRNARSLRTSVTETIGLHIPEFLTSAEYYMSFVFGVIEEATRASLNVTLMSAGHLGDGPGAPQVDGLVLCDPMAGDPVVDQLMSCGLPVVTAERYAGDKESTGVVLSDHHTHLEQLLDHLGERGARQVAFLASDTTAEWATTLCATYSEWCARRGAPDLTHRAPFGSTPEALQAEVRRMLVRAPGIDAIVCAADGAAAAILPELRAAGRTVGEDLLLASCVDSSSMRLADPPITSIELHPRAVGAECARLLCEILARQTPQGTIRSVPIELNIRNSSRPTPTR
ncbi:LacI family DNA-binding transcriptional regulator [Streptomyces sp. NPDC059477]|uniref:LacI family DNA-binding transcriptional regulator n=1 Tax=Streptomyces sp. NPDC059477 TaxID=3346847 RepID=UPI0036C5308D